MRSALERLAWSLLESVILCLALGAAMQGAPLLGFVIGWVLILVAFVEGRFKK